MQAAFLSRETLAQTEACQCYGAQDKTGSWCYHTGLILLHQKVISWLIKICHWSGLLKEQDWGPAGRAPRIEYW